MPGWPDLWREVLGLWRFYILVAFFAVIALMLWAPRIWWFWARVILRIVGGAVGVVALLVVGVVANLAAHDPKPEYRTVTSPSGVHRAILKYQSVWLAMGYTQVRITLKCSCRHFNVFEYGGASDITATKMTWLDDSHLRITYYADPREFQRCISHAAGVTITGVPFAWPSN
jgi:hypothetical protein